MGETGVGEMGVGEMGVNPSHPNKSNKRNQQNNVFITVEGNSKIRNYSGFSMLVKGSDFTL